MTVTSNNLIGKVYPFFLDNNKLSSYYLYQIISPKLSSNLTPFFTITKISERTEKGEPYGSDDNIISVINQNKKMSANDNRVFVEDLLKKDVPYVEPNEKNFPLIELESGINLQKSLIVSLRDLLRWNKYKFAEGKKIDVLVAPDKFLICNIRTNNDTIWLEPENLYSVMDPNMSNPLDLSVNKMSVSSITKKFSGKNRISELNRAIKRYEYNNVAFNFYPAVEEEVFEI